MRSVQNNNTSFFITKEQMQSYSYLYENTMFTNKWDSTLWGKENAREARGEVERVALIKSFI